MEGLGDVDIGQGIFLSDEGSMGYHFELAISRDRKNQ